MPRDVPFGSIPATIRKPGRYLALGGDHDKPIQLSDIHMMTRQGHTIVYWMPVSDGGLDDEITVLMALSDNEVWPGFRVDGQWFFVTGDPCSETPTHWAEMPPTLWIPRHENLLPRHRNHRPEPLRQR